METLKKAEEFNNIYWKGEKLVTQNFIIYVKINNGDKKYGLVVKKKIGNAVLRNRLRRVLRHILLINENSLRNSINILIIPKGNALLNLETIRYKPLEKEILYSLKRKNYV